MKVLSHPILQDCRRVIERSPDLSPEFKSRVLHGLCALDEQLEADQQAAPPAPLPKAGKGSR
jgi:hypothetical protein